MSSWSGWGLVAEAAMWDGLWGLWYLVEVLLAQPFVFTGLGVLQWLLGLHAGWLPADETQDCQDDEWVPGAAKHPAVPG